MRFTIAWVIYSGYPVSFTYPLCFSDKICILKNNKIYIDFRQIV